MSVKMKYQNQTSLKINRCIRGEKACRNLAVLISSFLLAFVFASIFTPVEDLDALTCADDSVTDPGSTSASAGDICNSASSDVSVTVENPAFISVTSFAGAGVALNYTNGSGNNLGEVIAASDTVTTTSNTGQVKHLYISTTSSTSNNLVSDETDLENGKTYIAAGGGNTLDTATALSDNTWGFALPAGTSGLPANAFDNSYTNVSNSSRFAKVPTLGNDVLVQEEIGTFDSITGEYSSAAEIYYGVLATTDIYAGSYSNTIRYTAYTETTEQRTIQDLTYMQEMNSTICANTPTNTTAELLDLRGYGNAGADKTTTYGVLKAADGNCWMTDNLNLYNKTGENALTYKDSDFTEGAFELPESSDWGTNDYSQQLLHVADGTGASASSDSKYYGQVYYNWCSAVALTDCSTTEEQNQSICPKNWKLPKGGTSASDTTTNGSWPKLVNKYKELNGGTLTGKNLTTADTSAVAYPLGFRLYYGRWSYSSQSESDQGRGGKFWSSTPFDSSLVYYFNYYSSNTKPYDNYYRGYGQSVRCVVPVD